MKTNKKLNFYVKGCKKLVDMPYNQLNLDNYVYKMEQIYKIPNMIEENYTFEDEPCKLMSGQHVGAQIINYPSESTSKKRKIYIVGKGILFDAGGYDLKHKMLGMKSDMAGMATAFAVASYFNREDVIAFCPVATNFIHNNKITPGDYIKIGKKEVEIINTDAEGRLILAEALSHLEPTKDDIVITVATLTGACAYAVGEKATAFMTPNDYLAKNYYKSSGQEKELAWRLPLWNYLQKELFNKKRIPNCTKKKCGTITAGLFLKQFVKYPNNWIHLDIASSAYIKDKATGQPIKTLVRFIERLK